MSEKGPEEAAKERQVSERRVMLLISGRPPHPLRRAQVSVTMAEKTLRRVKHQTWPIPSMCNRCRSRDVGVMPGRLSNKECTREAWD